MAPEAIYLCLFVLDIIGLGGKLHAAPYEILAYQETLQLTAKILDHVRSLHQESKWCPRDLHSKMHDQLEEIKLALEIAKNAVRWMDGEKTHGRQFPHAVVWHFAYKQVAVANGPLLDLCSRRLMAIEEQLGAESAMRSQRQEKIYFEDIGKQLRVALSKRTERYSLLYSGVGEQMSRSPAVSSNFSLPICISSGQ